MRFEAAGGELFLRWPSRGATPIIPVDANHVIDRAVQLAGAMTTPLHALIVPMSAAHWPLVRAIYEAGIATGNATFQTEAPSWESWNAGHLATCRFVALVGDAVVGWAALSPVSARPVYAGVCEVSVYVAETARGRGVGRALLAAIIECSERDGRWTLQAGIFPENDGSIALHRSAGFRVIGRRERVGLLHGRWRDVLLLERRSDNVGVD